MLNDLLTKPKKTKKKIIPENHNVLHACGFGKQYFFLFTEKRMGVRKEEEAESEGG
jgi:galactose-1-phosphate uridylyltransferase